MPRQFDWPTIRSSYERGVSPTEIAQTLPDCPSRQAIEKRAKKEGWAVAKLPETHDLTTNEGQKAVILSKVRSGAPLGLAARAAGITDRTLRNWRADDSAFAEMLEASRAAFLTTNIERIHEAGERDWKAAAYLVERASETRETFSQSKTDGGLQIVLQIVREERPAIEHEP